MQPNLTQNEALEIAGAWWVLALVGLASVIAGGILVAKPSHSLATLSVVFGIFMLLDGIAELVASLRGEAENRGLSAIVGVVGVIVGIILIRHPTHAVAAIGLVIGIWLVVAGLVRLVRAIVIGGRVLWHLAIAALEIAVGVAIVSDPHIGYATLAVVAGIWLIVNGVANIAVAVTMRAAKSALIAESGTPSQSLS